MTRAESHLAFAGVEELAARVRSGDVTPRELVELFLARTRRLLRLGGAVPKPLADRLEARGHRDPLFDDHDLLLSPVTASTAPPVGQYVGCGAIRTYLGTTSFFTTLPAWNLTGQPAASVPAGLAPDGMPVGVQLVSRPHDEATLLAVAAQIERVASLDGAPWR